MTAFLLMLENNSLLNFIGSNDDIPWIVPPLFWGSNMKIINLQRRHYRVYSSSSMGSNLEKQIIYKDDIT